MSTPVIQGQVVQARQPDAVLDPISTAAHDFGNVAKALVTRSGAFHNESELQKAHSAIDSFVKFITPQKDRTHVITEDDQAPVEDVSRRIPPNSTGQAVVHAGPQIDYNKLAAALIAAQQAQAAADTAPADGAS